MTVESWERDNVSNLSRVTGADIVSLPGFEPGTFGSRSRCIGWLGGAAVERSALDQQAADGPWVQFPAGRLQNVVLPLITE